MTQTADASGRFTYRILGLDPSRPEGQKFQSREPDLDLKFQMWGQECPYNHAGRSGIDIIKDEDYVPATD